MTNQTSEDEKLAKLFHDTYERLAPEFNYKTRKASAVPWSEVPPNNKGLMIAVAHEINDAIRTEKLKLLAEVREQTTIFKIKAHDKKGQPHLYEAGRGIPIEALNKLEAEL